MAEILNCEKRDVTGTLRIRRLRESGMTPAILYGRGATESLVIPTKDIDSAVRHGMQIVELKGGFNESALIKEVQWDAFGVEVLHLDLTRIDASEAVELSLHVELVGVAPGTRSGGSVQHLLHSVDVLIPANAVPEKLELKINDMELHQDLKAGDIPLPAGATLITGADEIVVQCVEVIVRDEDLDAEDDGAAEPEVIGRKPSDEDASED